MVRLVIQVRDGNDDFGLCSVLSLFLKTKQAKLWKQHTNPSSCKHEIKLVRHFAHGFCNIVALIGNDFDAFQIDTQVK